MTQPHERIYLQCNNEDGEYIGHLPGAEVTWCNGKIDRHDVEYILASELYALRERVAEFEYAVNAGNTARQDVPANTLSKWFRYVYTGEK